MDVVPQTDFWAMLEGATLTVKIVLLLLAGMSFLSWSIIFFKIFSIGGARRSVVSGLEHFQYAEDLGGGLQAIGQNSGSPLFTIGNKAVNEFKRLEKSDLDIRKKRELVKDTLRRVLRQGISSEMERLSASLPFLATCANAAPFIGLFGTVWGIMHAFHSIGAAKSAALATVAPGISEALVATAIGLAVAIPATVAYNYFNSVLGRVETDLINFAGAFLNRVEREVPWTKPEQTHGGSNLLG